MNPNERAGAWARRYLLMGLNPLPSCSDRKRPALRRYAAYRDGTPIPEKWLPRWWAPNVQIPTGTAWRLAVVDLDGPAAIVRWTGLVRQAGGAVPTWTVATGGGGRHLYFRLPEGLDACPTRRLWALRDDPAANAWVKHTMIELKGDRGLVVAPPSRHVDTGIEYRFLPGRSPREIGPPAPIPDWVLLLPTLVAPVAFVPPPPVVGRRARRRRSDRYRAWHDVLDALSPAQKLELARGWGLRLASDRVNPAGWISCHAVGRPDRHPSAGFHPESGYYSEVEACRMNLFDLGVALGAYATWLDCLNDLGEMSR